MKVFIVGGYGVFGGRLTRLLLRDGAQVCVAGRDLRQAHAFTCRYGGDAFQLDVGGDLAPIVRAAPDVVVPGAYRARSVICRVGLERWVMNAGLAVFGYLRRRMGLRDLRWLAPLLIAGSKPSSRLSSGVSGTVVELIGLKDEQPLRRRWQLAASKGQGSFIPALAARAAIGNCGCLAPGARPFLGDLTLPQIASAMAELSITDSFAKEPAPTLLQTALGDRWLQLPQSVQRLHSVQDRESFSGRARVTRGRGLLARLAAWYFAFPTAADDVELTLTKTRTPRGEVWERDFAGRRFRSVLTASVRPCHYRERFGALTYEQALPVENATLSFLVERGWFLGVPIPSFLLPRSCAKEFAVNDHFHFDVGLYAPLTGELIVRYQGQVRPDAAGATGAASCDSSGVRR